MQPNLLIERFDDERINDRYCVGAVLGHGGMACVYRVRDTLIGKDVALKVLMPRTETEQRAESLAIFEREFHTLVELRHPSVIQVHDYGITESGPYYTMELLDGGDLRDRSPLAWRAACRVFFDICSSLALLHSRRLIHRDISPRNIRCALDGSAKLIDFGAMLSMGPSHQVVGTPAFVAPEAVQGMALDGRTDLYSVGACLYYSLTGQPPGGARDFSQVLAMAQRKPLAPSQIVADVPAALDELVLALIDPEPALRPRTAFEVMQRLAAIGGLLCNEPPSVTQAYLSTPVLVGRDDIKAKLRERIERCVAGHGSSLLLEAPPGMGRTRILDECALEGQTLGATVLHVRAATASGHDFSAIRALLEPLLAIMPEALIASARVENRSFNSLFDDLAGLRELATRAGPERARFKNWRDAGLTRSALHNSLRWFIARATEYRPLVIAIDDIHALDAASGALLASLIHKTKRSRLLLVFTLQTDAACRAPAAVSVISDRSRKLQLPALSSDETAALMRSMFGDVPHVALMADRIHAVARGNPSESMELAQYLVDLQTVRYEGGNWTLPARLAVSDLPVSATDALRSRMESLSVLARELAELQALALRDGFARETYYELAGGVSAEAVDAAIDLLQSARVVQRDSQMYAFTHQAWKLLLRDSLSAERRERCHRQLAEYCARTNKPEPHEVHHLLCAGDVERALDRLVAHLGAIGDDADLNMFITKQTSPHEMVDICMRCLEAAERASRPAREQCLIRRWTAVLSVLTEDEFYLVAAPPWRAQLEHDSGLSIWHELSDVADPGERLMQTLQATVERYTATPEAERVYRPDEAVRLLVGYVTFSLAIGARRLDAQLLDSLPGLLEPFAPLSPMIHAVWQTALATHESLCRCQVERASARWLDVYERLEQVTGDELRYAELIRDGVAYAIGSNEAGLGIQSAARWANQLDADPLQAVNAMYLRKVVRLQQGDLEGAERFRHKAELLALQAETVQMFTTTVATELIVHALSWDLTGVRQLADRIAPLAKRCPPWAAYLQLAHGYFERLRGDPAAALAAFDQSLALTAPSEAHPYLVFAWPRAIAGKADALIDLGRYQEAATLAGAALAHCRAQGVGILCNDIIRALALAEAKLGEHQGAADRLEGAIAAAVDCNISGLNLGVLYEARARVALEARDLVNFEHYARLTAREYRHGRRSPLGARYERLLDEARRVGPEFADAVGFADRSEIVLGHAGSQLQLEVAEAMAGAERAEGRPQRALRLLCELHGVGAGHLFLNDADSLRLAASYGNHTADDELLTIARDRFRHELCDDTEVTRVASDTSTARLVPENSLCWSDPDGQTYHSRTLHCLVNGVACSAGVVILQAQATPRRANRLLQFTTALSAYLISSGESSGR